MKPLFHLFVLTFLVGIGFFLWFSQAPMADAVVRTWDGEGTTNNWSEDANWTANTEPGASDVATFDATSTKVATIDVAISVGGIDINTGYTGTITQATGITVTVGSSNYDQADGTLTGGNSAFDLNGSFTLSAGTFTATTGTMTVASGWTHTLGGTFTHNSGTVTFDGNPGAARTVNVNVTETFYNLTWNDSGGWASSVAVDDLIVVNNTLTLTNAGLNSSGTGGIKPNGNVVVASTWDGGNAVMTFEGTAAQTFDLTGGTGTYNGSITVNKASGTITLLSDIVLDASQTFTMTSGTFDCNGFNFTLGNLAAVTDFFKITGGTFTGGSGTLDFNSRSDMNLSGGTFNATSGNMTVMGGWANGGTTFNHNNGTLTFDSNPSAARTINANVTETFYNLTMNTLGGWNNTISAGDTLVITNTLALTDGGFSTGTFEARGNVTIGVGYDGGTSVLNFTNTSNQNFDLTGATGVFNNDITINKSSGTVILLSALLMDASSQDLTITSGTLDLEGQNLTVNGTSGTVVVSNGGILRLQGGESITALSGNPQLQAGSTVTYDGTTGPYTLKDYTYDGLTINGVGATFSPAANETLGGNLTVTGGTLDVNDLTLAINGNTTINGGTLKSGTNTVTFGNAAGDTVTISSGTFEIESDAPSTDIVKNAGTWTNSGGTITYNSATGISVDLLSALGPYFNLTINSSGSTYTLTANLDVDGSLTLTAGTLSVSGSNYSMNVGAGWTDTGAGTFTEGTGTVTFDGTGTVNANEVFNNVTVSGSGTVTLGAALDVDGGVTISGGTLDVSASNYQINVAASWTDTGTGAFTEQSGTVVFDGTGTVNSNEAFENLTINSAGTVTLGGALDADGTLTLTAGTLDVSASNYGITVGGGWTDTGAGAFTEQAGTVTFDGTGTVNANEPFEHFTVNSSGTVTLGAALDADGNITITAGTLDVSVTNYGITVGGNWAKTGTFTQRSGTVTFDTAALTSTISGSTTFNHFTSTTAGKPLTFTAGTTQTISGTLTLTGASGNLIVLRSTVNASQWNLTANGTISVSYVDVKDSNASGGTAISQTNSTDSGNNTNWVFNLAPTVASVTAVQSASGGTVSISFIIDDVNDDNTVRAQIEYSLNGGTSWSDPTLASTVTATTGSVTVDNAQTYQVGQAGGYIQTSSGANTLTITWNASTDVANTTDISNARIRVTPNDTAATGTAGSSANFILDVVQPTGLTSFNSVDFSNARVQLSWSAAADTNFNHYEIWSAESESNVNSRNGSAQEWDNDNDTTLTSASSITSTINNTDPRNKYFKIFAVDNYGNEKTLTAIYVPGGQSSSSDSSSGVGTSDSSSDASSSSDSATQGSSTAGESEIEEGGAEGDTEEEIASDGEQATGDEEATSGEESASDEESTIEQEEQVGEQENEQEAQSFWDDYEVPDHWSSGYVKHLQEEDHVVEVAVETPTFVDILVEIFFNPDASINRGEAIEFLITLVGFQVDTVSFNARERAFSDVSENHERVGFIQFAYEQGLVSGYPDGTYLPEYVINRAETLKMVSYFYKDKVDVTLRGGDLLAAYRLSQSPFSDIDLEAWYAPYVVHAYSNGVIKGYGDGTFRPANSVSFAEFLKIATLSQNIEDAVEMASELE